MRRTILTTLVLLCCVALVQAQTIIPKVGVTFGSTNAEFVNTGGVVTDGVDISSNTGFTVGAAYEIPVGELGGGKLSIQPELAFIQKGFQADASGELFLEPETGFEFTVEQSYKLNYIEVPVLVKLEFGSGNARFAPYLGPSIALGLGGKVDGAVKIDDGTDIYEVDIDGDIKFGDAPENPGDDDFDVYLDNRLDFGLQVGVGVTLFEKVVVDLRYGLGLTDLADDEDSANRVLQFTVGVPLSLH